MRFGTVAQWRILAAPRLYGSGHLRIVRATRQPQRGPDAAEAAAAVLGEELGFVDSNRLFAVIRPACLCCRRVVRTARLPDGTLWPMPITLDISDKLVRTQRSTRRLGEASLVCSLPMCFVRMRVCVCPGRHSLLLPLPAPSAQGRRGQSARDHQCHRDLQTGQRT